MSKARDALKASEEELVEIHRIQGKIPIEDCWRIAFNLDDEDMKSIEAVMFTSVGMLHAGLMRPEAILFSLANIGKHLGRADSTN